MQKIITIVVPVYNVQEYLDRCIKSIISQSYKNLEIILVDDGSTDQSGMICDKYKEIDSRVKVIHKENGGLSSARNAALDIMTGQYVGFVDSDDYIHECMIEKMMKAAYETASDIVVCNHYVEKKNSLLIEDPIIDEKEIIVKKKALELLIEDKFIRSYAWDKLYKSSLFMDVRYPDGRNYEDIPTTYLLFDKVEQVTKIPDYLYYYQIREDSISFGTTDEKWFRNCEAIILGRMEMYNYFFEKNESDLAQRAFAKLLPYLYTAIKFANILHKKERVEVYKKYLIKYKKFILENKFVSKKDKKVLDNYMRSALFIKVYFALKDKMQYLLWFYHKLRSKVIVDKIVPIDFTLKTGKKNRIIYFEMPCFDNLGDHAIAYAQKKYLEYYQQMNPKTQLYIIPGWSTLAAISQLKSVISKEDVIVCHGGGNFGNLYMFAEGFRRKVFKNFPENKIILFPQTIYFSEDKEGIKELAKSQKIINKCKHLTLLARDHHSYELMIKYFDANIYEMNDIVSYLDESKYASDDRNGIILCLRSDVESALSADEKKRLQKQCEIVNTNVLITDTMVQRDVPDSMREKELIAKWKEFGKAELVVTDRLHGMIFALITKTPCIILGNNHYKVYETFLTLQNRGYLYYANTVEEAGKMIQDYRNYLQEDEKSTYKVTYDKLNQIMMNL